METTKRQRPKLYRNTKKREEHWNSLIAKTDGPFAACLKEIKVILDDKRKEANKKVIKEFNNQKQK